MKITPLEIFPGIAEIPFACMCFLPLSSSSDKKNHYFIPFVRFEVSIAIYFLSRFAVLEQYMKIFMQT